MQVLRYSNSAHVCTIGSERSGNPQFMRPLGGIAFDSDGRIAMAEFFLLTPRIITFKFSSELSRAPPLLSPPFHDNKEIPGFIVNYLLSVMNSFVGLRLLPRKTVMFASMRERIVVSSRQIMHDLEKNCARRCSLHMISMQFGFAKQKDVTAFIIVQLQRALF
jgi:hypothetical protein